MTIVLVILKALTLIFAIILVFLVNKTIKRISTISSNYYTSLVDKLEELKNTVVTQVNTITTVIGSQQEEVVRLTNKVDEGLTHCGNQTRDLKEKFNILDSRLTAPIDKINDTHNRIKTLGKGATSTDELRTVVTEVVSAIVTEAVDSLSRKSPAKTKTVKKVDTELDKSLIKEAKS